MSFAEITVDKNSEFFIAICKLGVHSYVAAGVKERSGQHRFLGSFGKVGNPEKGGACTASKAICSTLFSETDAFITNERVINYKEGDSERRPAWRTVRYKAYGITYRHYLQFLAHMAALSHEQEKALENSRLPSSWYKLKAYTPIEEDETTVGFKWGPLSIEDYEQELDVCPNEFHLAAFGNTCRHSAIRLVEAARQTAGLGEGVSTTFFRELPLEADFGRGVVGVDHHFYILPLPPTSYPEIGDEKQAILVELYDRLDSMMLIAQDDPNSIEKFEELKKLYQETAGKVPDSIHDVIISIKEWESDHKDLIDTHRAWHFFSSTATRKMFNRLDEQFAQIRQDSDSEASVLCC
ncbi:hypothetical protein BN59_03330 [Legionella massiliensis]|uniref:Uncharacterized protein n=1 Tax=Legionella massiliensis TaxID=1034943 RepID=A0A078KX92_9GAMM|nr:hypothetical protein [Legionella massiliensis]CDZ79015.1 hypothetical protein BN59_03330 [Legionella massiliensis]CEE14753.1 hypothetical protein BN1094_03330 [Legionella massiliensis]